MQVESTNGPGDSSWLSFDIHGRAIMRVAADAPTAPQMADMFAAFRRDGISGESDLTATGHFEPMIDPAYGEHDYAYTAHALHMLRADVQVVADGDRMRVHGSRELLTTVLPVLDHVAARRGLAMIHAATFSIGGRGIAMPAWGGTGKTSTIAKLLRHDDVGFMGDDWAFLNKEQELLGFAKPMFIKPHHRPIYPHLFEGARKPLVPSRLSEPVSRFTTLVHPLVTQYPKVAAFSRRWSPEHRMVSVSEALPAARIDTRAPLAASIFVERYDGSRTKLEERDRDWMVARLVGNFHIEMTKFSQEVLAALGSTSIVPLEGHFAEKTSVVREAIRGLPAYVMQVPRDWNADRASDDIVRFLRTVADELPVAASALV